MKLGLRSIVRNTVGVVVALALGSPAAVRGAGHTDEPLAQVREKVTTGKARLVDVREQREWDQGHVRGAVLVPLSVLMTWDRDGISAADRARLEAALPKGTVIYCHCAAGARALPGGETLRKLGYDARALKPGYRALVNAGFPSEGGR